MRAYVNCPCCGGGGCGWQYECDVCGKTGKVSEEEADAYRVASHIRMAGEGKTFMALLAWKKGEPFRVG